MRSYNTGLLVQVYERFRVLSNKSIGKYEKLCTAKFIKQSMVAAFSSLFMLMCLICSGENGWFVCTSVIEGMSNILATDLASVTSLG